MSEHVNKCYFWGEKDETVKYFITECKNVDQRGYESRPDGVGQVIR